METVSLKEYFEKLRQADKEAVALALTAAEKAVQVAETNAEKWRDNANEWRGAMTDREKNFATKDELKNLKERADISQGKGLGTHQLWLILISIVGLIGTVFGIYKSIN